jgi:hypothetical protein
MLSEGDEVEHGGARFRVGRVERRRIRQVRFTPAAVEAGGADGRPPAATFPAVGLAA